MVDTPQSLADRLSEEGGRIVDFFKNLAQDQWSQCIYPEPGGWDMHQLLAHIYSSEIGRKELIADILAGGNGSPPEFDIDAFNLTEVDRLSGESNNSLLESFSQERAGLIELVSTMNPLDLARTGNDPFLGEAPLLDIIKLTYRHLQIHLRDARRCL